MTIKNLRTAMMTILKNAQIKNLQKTQNNIVAGKQAASKK